MDYDTAFSVVSNLRGSVQTPTPGTYTLTVTPYTEGARGGTAGTPLTINFTVVDGNSQSIGSLDLINADTDTVIGPLGQTIDYGTIGTQNLSIRANTNPATVGSVQFRLNGALIRTENIAPYTIAGDSANGTQFTPINPPLAVGQSYTLVVTPYTGSNGSGTVRHHGPAPRRWWQAA